MGKRMSAEGILGKLTGRQGRSPVVHAALLTASLAVILLMPCCGRGPSPDELLGATQGELDSYQKEMMAAAQAASAGDADGYKAHQDQADGHLRSVLERFENADAGESEDVDVLKAYAQALHWGQDWDLEAQVWERVASLEPENGNAWLSLGKARAQLGPEYKPKAEEAFQRALGCPGSASDTAKAHAELAELYRREGLYDFAREHFAKAIEAEPKHAAAHIGLAGLLVRDGKVREAVEEVESLGEVPPEQVNHLREVMSESVRDFEGYRRTFADEAANHMAYAKVLVWANRLGDCLMPLQRTTKLQPDNAVAWNFLGSILRQMGEDEKAKTAFEKSLALNPDQPHTRAVLEEMGKAEGQGAPQGDATVPPAEEEKKESGQ